ncbi:MAG: dicarboxylate/amino acid:cation symporter [Maioricimonas sp. JB049]
MSTSQQSSSQQSSSHNSSSLTFWIVIAIVAAIAISTLLPWIALSGLDEGSDTYAGRAASLHTLFEIIGFGGDIFLRLLKMMVVPLVIVSVMSGILGLGDVRKLGRPGLYTVAFYFLTTVLAVVLGLALVNIIRPGVGTVDAAKAEQIVAEKGAEIEGGAADIEEEGIGMILRNLALMLFTDNLIKSAANGDLLPLIVFSIVFAGMLTTLGERVATITKIISQFNHAIMAFVLLLMKIAPLGIFCLVAGRFGSEMVAGTFVATMKLIWWYTFTVIAALFLHALVTLPIILWATTRRNPYRFIYQMLQALLTAFSTASSSATLPVTMECAVDRAGVSRRSVDFVTPLGATINMDGTALYEAVAAIFIAQFLGIDLSFGQQLLVAVTATLAAIGAAGIPEAGLVTMLIVLHAVGLPLKYQAIILPVDWFLDRFRTAVNVFGDACGAAVVDPTFPSDSPSEPPPTPTPTTKTVTASA